MYMVNWNFEPTLDISGRSPGAPGFREVGDLLAEKAEAGVDVRIVLNGAQVPSGRLERRDTVPVGMRGTI